MCYGICLPHCSILYHTLPCVLLFIYTQKSACFIDSKMNGAEIYSCSVYCKASVRDVVEKQFLLLENISTSTHMISAID